LEEKKISIKQIAQITGYSVATVSRVINKMGKYSAETEQIINDVIKAHHFVPNMIAKGLRTNNAKTIGIITPDIREEFMAVITLAAQNTLFEAGYSAFICNSNEKSQVEARHLDLLRAQNIGGIIFIGSESVYKGAVYDSIPKIYVDRVPITFVGDEEYVFIESESSVGGALAIRHLAERGCRKIISIFEGRNISPCLTRQEGVRQEYARLHIDPEETFFFCSPPTFEACYAVTKEILARGIPFDGFFCYCDPMAAGAIRALTEAGYRVPEDVKVVGFDDTSISSHMTPTITTVRQDMKDMGAIAARVMLGLIDHTYDGPNRIKLPVELIERESTRV